jgi:hypothetical protein
LPGRSRSTVKMMTDTPSNVTIMLSKRRATLVSTGRYETVAERSVSSEVELVGAREKPCKDLATAA